MAGEGDAERLVVLLEARIRDFEKNMDKASGTASRSYDRMRRGSQSATRQMEQDMARSTTRINQMLAGTSTKIGSFGKAFVGGFMGGMFVGGLEGLARGVKGVVSELAALHKTIERVGLSAKVFQELEFGFKLAGVEAGAFTDGMDKFNKNIAVAATQGGKLAEILKANGIAIRDQNGKIRDAGSLLRDYANLVKNAGSEAEQMLLVTEAFGRGDANFVNALKNGAAGLDDMGRAAAEAGGTIDEELLKKADEVDDAWDRTWRNFEINARSAIMSVIDDISRIRTATRSAFAEFEGRRNAAIAGDMVGSLAGTKADPGTSAGSLVTPDGPTLPGTAPIPTTRPADKPTVIPIKPDKPGGSSRNRAAEKALLEAEAVKKLIDNLSEELRLVGASDLEKAKSNALRHAGAAATDKQRKQIEQLVTEIYNETKAHEQATQAAEFFRETMADSFMSIIPAIETGNKALDGLLNTLMQAVAQAALLGNGPLAGLLGGGGIGGGLLGAIFPFADGGIAAHGLPRFAGGGVSRSAAIFGEAGPEAAVPLPDGRRIPVDLGGSGGGNSITIEGSTVTIQGNADQSTVAELKRYMDERDRKMMRDLPKMVDGRMDARQTRRTRP